MRIRAIASTVVFGFVVACGGGSSPPAAASGGADAGAVESFGTPHPEDLAELDAGAKATTTADAGSAPAPAASAAPAAPADECTPVGVDFEKRARPKLKDCYAEGKKKDPNLQGTVKITVEIDYLGKVKVIKILEKTLPDPVAQCMLKVVKATPLTEAAKCPGKSLTIPVTFPTPH
jgi:hypothetical protein